MNIYTPEGWLDISMIDAYMDVHNLDQCFIVGARGTGKSYGIQKKLLMKSKKFIYARMSAGEIKMISNPEMNPFNAFYDDPDLKDRVFSVKPIPKVENALYLVEEKTNIAICLPLVTFGKYRGMDFHEYEYIFLDEFIPERTIKKTPGMGQALKQAYETVNRNRELKGEKAVRLYAAANSLDMNNEILLEFGLIPMMEKCLKSDKEYWIEGNKILIYPQHSPISEAKADTSLYKFGTGKFGEMALKNQFSDYGKSNLGSRSLKGCIQKFCLKGNFSAYRLQNGEWYFTEWKIIGFKVGETIVYQDTDYDKRLMLRKFFFLVELYYNGRVIFETPEYELLFLKHFKVKL